MYNVILNLLNRDTRPGEHVKGNQKEPTFKSGLGHLLLFVVHQQQAYDSSFLNPQRLLLEPSSHGSSGDALLVIYYIYWRSLLPLTHLTPASPCLIVGVSLRWHLGHHLGWISLPPHHHAEVCRPLVRCGWFSSVQFQFHENNLCSHWGSGGCRVWRRCRVSYGTGASNCIGLQLGKACCPCSR